MEYLWRWFEELTDWRESGFAVGPISHVEIFTWAKLMRINIGPSEVMALRMLDRLFRSILAEEGGKEESSESGLAAGLKQVAKERGNVRNG